MLQAADCLQAVLHGRPRPSLRPAAGASAVTGGSLRMSAGYGNELGVPGPSQNLSPLGAGLPYPRFHEALGPLDSILQQGSAAEEGQAGRRHTAEPSVQGEDKGRENA